MNGDADSLLTDPAAAAPPPVIYLPYAECRAVDGPLPMSHGRVAMCGCAVCRPQNWCRAMVPGGGRCLQPRSRRPEARRFQYCDGHYFELVCRQAPGVPRDVLTDIVRTIFRSELTHQVKFRRDGFSSAAGLLAELFIPAARRAGLIDGDGKPTFEL